MPARIGVSSSRLVHAQVVQGVQGDDERSGAKARQKSQRLRQLEKVLPQLQPHDGQAGGARGASRRQDRSVRAHTASVSVPIRY